MVRNVIASFFGLVLLFFIVRYPTDVIGLLNLFVEAADKMANALQGLVHTLPAKVNGTTGAS
jgi:hypothetical protein